MARNTALGVDRIELTPSRSRGQGDVLLLYTAASRAAQRLRRVLGEEASLRRGEATPPGRSDRQALADDLRAMLERFSGDQMPEDDRAF